MRALASLMLCSIVACAAPSESGSAGSTGAEDEWIEDEPQVVHHEGAIEALGITPPETPWLQMDAFEREMYMVGKVMPIMHELFARHDAGRFAQMECETCHGKDMREVAFAMPSKHMYRVPEPGSRAWENMERDFGPMVAFMTETVTPVMGTLLGESSYTCGHCHATTE